MLKGRTHQQLKKYEDSRKLPVQPHFNGFENIKNISPRLHHSLEVKNNHGFRFTNDNKDNVDKNHIENGSLLKSNYDMDDALKAIEYETTQKVIKDVSCETNENLQNMNDNIECCKTCKLPIYINKIKTTSSTLGQQSIFDNFDESKFESTYSEKISNENKCNNKDMIEEIELIMTNQFNTSINNMVNLTMYKILNN